MSVNERELSVRLIQESEESTDEVDSSNDPSPRRKKESNVIKPSRLIEAVRRDTSGVSLLLQEKTDVDDLDIKATDNFQRNAFHHAISKPDTLRLLLEQLTKIKSSVADALKQKDYEGEAPIHHAAITANVESLEILYNYDNSLVNLKTRVQKKSVLHLAVESRSVVSVKFLLSKDLYLMNSMDNMSQTPVHYAASQKQTSILELLISKGSHTTPMDLNNQLPLHIAALNGLRNSTELLVRHDPDSINRVDISGQSPTLLAAKSGFPKLVSYLLDKGANCSLQDNSGLTAFDWAVKQKQEAVVRVFLNKLKEVKEVVKFTEDDPEECLAAMVESVPDLARALLDKCFNDQESRKITYDFSCLESKDEKTNRPRLKALQTMLDTECDTCIRHPVVEKYVNIKWRSRAMKFIAAVMLMKLLFHICLLVYTTRVIGVVSSSPEKTNNASRNVVITRVSRPPNATEMIALRAIIVAITVVEIFRELDKLMAQHARYFCHKPRYYKLVMLISVMFYMFPAKDTLTVKQIAFGAVAVFTSWLNCMQALKLTPVLGIYIILVEKVFWSVAKMFFVVAIYLVSFACTFYILLGEHYNFRNIYISFPSTFVAMMNGFDYDNLFVEYGWHPGIYELKMVFLFLFMLIMCIVVNNALIGLAVGDTNDVMNSAKFDRFRLKAEIVIHYNKTLIAIFKDGDLASHEEPKKRENSFFHKIAVFLLPSQKDDIVDGSNEKNKDQLEMELVSLDEHVEKAIEMKLENLHSKLQHELSGIRDQINEDFDEKIGKILATLK